MSTVQPAEVLRRPTEAQLESWRSFLRAHAVLMRCLEQELVEKSSLPLTWYDVLVQLAEAPEGRLRMTDLSDRLVLSRSGVTRLVDRLVLDGLVERGRCPLDRRGIYAVLTATGRRRLREAAPTHLDGVARHVTEPLTAAELAELGRIMEIVLAAEQRNCTQPPNQ